MLYLLAFPPKWLGLSGAIGLAGLGLIPRALLVLGTMGSAWMLSGIGWLSLMAFYLMTALWPVLLVFLLRRSPRAALLARWMTPLAVVEGLGSLNAIAGLLMTVFTGGAPRSIAKPLSATVFAAAQVFFLLRTSKD